MKKMKVVLCKLNSDYCPEVELMDDGRIRIGEEPEYTHLTKDQWNILVDKIEKKELTKVQ